jgi:hypothetical protein
MSQTSIAFTDGDREQIAYIQDVLGVSLGEAVRTAVRSFATDLVKIEDQRIRRERGRR